MTDKSIRAQITIEASTPAGIAAACREIADNCEQGNFLVWVGGSGGSDWRYNINYETENGEDRDG